MSSESSPRHSSASVKHGELRLLNPLSSISPSTPLIQLPDSSGPLTPDTVPIGNPFAALNANPLVNLPSIRTIGDYELSETKLDDFKCARYLPTGEALLYKEYSHQIVRQRLEPYQRLLTLLQLTNKHQGLTTEQIAKKHHLHFFRDILTLERTSIVIYSNYTTNLHQYITEKHRLNENETRQLFSQIVRAVQMCHRVGLIVRDLKLRKIIFDNQNPGQLLLTGLDEAIMLTSPQSDNDMVSSRFSCPVYACPEIVLNRQMYSGKMADSWSLGIILYTMLFGRYPFCDRTLVGLFIKIGRCRPDIPRTISLKARSLLRSLIRVKPDERLLTQDLLGHVWFGGERCASTISMSTSPSISPNSTNTNSNSTEDSLLTPSISQPPLSTYNSICTNQSDLSAKEDAVVPNFDCE